MKKITLFLIMLGLFLTASAQHSFDPIVGPITVSSGNTTPINLNDVANSAGVPASSSGSYTSFSVSADWSAGSGIPWSQEAQLTVVTTAGEVVIDPPTSGIGQGEDTTLTFVGEFAGAYIPSTDGFLDLIFDQSYGGSQADYSNIQVTIFESPTCVKPTGMSTSMISLNSADLTWLAGLNETDWNIEYKSLEDFTPGNGEEEGSDTVSGTPATSLTGLIESTQYFVYYQANCGTDDGLSEWNGPFTFYTGYCPSIPTSNDGQGISQIVLGNQVFASGGDLTYEDFTDTVVDLASSINTNMQITFATGLTYNAHVWIDFNNDMVFDNDTELVYSGESASGNPSVLDASFIMPETPVGVYNMRMGSADFGQSTPNSCYSGSWGVTADFKINITEAPTCVPPYAFTATEIGANTANLSWTQPGEVTLWNIEIVESGTTPTGTPTESGISNPYTATNLTGLTTYDYYVQANCGSELSTWSGPFTFTTLCDVINPDYIQTFNTIIPDCWDEANNGTETTGPTDFGASSWTQDGFLNNGFTGAYRINLYSNNQSDWLISPLFDLTGGPFQVEFDFGVMKYASSTIVGSLGSDDYVKLLITTDNGATWTTLLTYDNTSVFTLQGEHPVVDLTDYEGQIVQFGILASEGTVNDIEDNDVFVDNFRVRGIPTCTEPTELSATNLSLTSTELSWTENGTSTSWNIQYGEEGFTLGTGTIVENVDTNPYTLTGLTADTSYEFYVQSECGPGDLSSFHGPYQFFTGYCESVPTSNDGTGVANVMVGVTDFPTYGDVTYENHTTPVVNVFQGLDTTVEIEFAHTWSHDTNIWIDFNNDLVFDETELVFQGESPGGAGQLLDATFLMPLTAPLGEHRMRIGTAYSGQATPNPCYNGSWGTTLDFTINVQQLNCTLPTAEFTTVPDCDNDQFYIGVNVTDLGSATSLEISNNFDEGTVTADALDVYQAGPFPFGSTVKIFVTNEQDNNCVISSDNYQVLACPPVNDDCSGAINAVVNEFSTCEAVTPGTILAATPSGVPNGSCSGTPNDDVWFTFEALNEVQIISLQNISNGTFNLDHAVYEGSCGELTELYCSSDDSSITPILTVGSTYYVRVFSGGNLQETSTFDLCIRPAPSNIICEDAENFCSVGGALTAPNVIGVPGFGSVACLYSTPNPTWNIIQVGESGSIEIEISQVDDNGNGLDVDFVIWGPFTSVSQACTDILLEECDECPNNTWQPEFYPYGNIVDCSYDAATVENLTIDNAQSGEIYMLLVTNYNGGVGSITIEQTNIGAGDNGTIEAEITAEIVSDDVIFQETETPGVMETSACGYESVTIVADSPFADEFTWYKDGFIMEGETSSTLVVTESNNYQVQAYDSQCGSEAYSQIVIVNLYEGAAPLAPQTLEVCDGPEGDGIESFDLDAFTASLNLGEGFTVTYYTSPADANQAINAVTSPYVSSGETLIIRIEDSAAAADNYLGCRELSSVELIVAPRPVINQPADFVVCDDLDGTVDGVTEFDLTSINDEVTTEAGIEITYHTSQEAADNGTAPIASPYTSSGETIYVRAYNPETGCYETTTFDLEINLVPLADFNPDLVYAVCPDATVPVYVDIVPTNFTADQVSVTWTLDGSPVSGGNGLSLGVLLAGEYEATITFNESGCSNTISRTVEELESCVIPQGISPGVSPGQNDNFDLSSYNVTKLEIFNRHGRLVYSKTNYTNEWYGQTNDGEELPVGTYFYTMEYEGGTKTRSAWVYINR